MLTYTLSFYILVLAVATTVFFKQFLRSYLLYLDCFLNNKNRPIKRKLYLLFRAYLLLGCIIAGSVTVIEIGADIGADMGSIETSFSLLFISSCFLLFISRVCTTTKSISVGLTAEHVEHHINHINFLAFFGMITGILKILIVFDQNPELITSIVKNFAAVTFEVDLPFVSSLIQMIAIPLVFSLFEFVLIINRRGIGVVCSDMKRSFQNIFNH